MITRRNNGSILVAVLGLVAILSALLISYMDEAVARMRYSGMIDDNTDLREKAYGGLEASLAVLAQLKDAGYGPGETGNFWREPLKFADFTLYDDCEISAECEDESAKLPLAALSEEQIAVLLEVLGLRSGDADDLAKSISDWMDPDDDARANSMDGDDYEMAPVPCIPTNAVPRTWEEFALLEPSGFFFDADGVSTELFDNFRSAVSLLNPSKVNINNAPSVVIETLGELGSFDYTDILREIEGIDGLRGSDNDKLLTEHAGADSIKSGSGDALVAYEPQLLRLRVVSSRGESRFSLDVLLVFKGTQGDTASDAAGRGPKLDDAYRDFPDDPESKLSYPFEILQICENSNAP